MRFVHVFGTLQMVLLLTLVYWLMIPLVAIPRKLLSDPLQLRNSGERWHDRDSAERDLDWMKKQG